MTNGVHVSSWDSAEADAVWTCACGKERWLGSVEDLCADVAKISDEDVWNLRVSQRQALIHYARRRLVRQMAGRGAPAELTEKAARVLDPNALTLGFARRFAEYKRPNLLLQDPDRLAALLRNPHAPVQLVVAGKAHPNDPAGKALVQAMTRFAARADVWDRVVFLEDYDMALAEFLVAGIDVWLNTPRRPWEACGTSGMKVLVNGGLNLSVLDGWWAEAYRPEVGWALSGEEDRDDARHDAADAVNLYAVLEREVVPEFYDRDPAGIPRRWLERIRTSMAHLTPQFSSNRMVREYVESFYLPAAREVNRRQDHSAKLAQELDAWHRRVREGWKTLRFGDMQVAEEPDHWRFEVPVYLADLLPHDIQVELYADPLRSGEPPLRIAMEQGEAIPGTVHGYVYGADAPTSRPSRHFTPRVVPFHPDAHVPLEETLILWRR